MDDFARGEMLTGFFDVFLVEAAGQLLDDIAHAQVGQGGQGASIGVGAVVGRKVDARRDKFFYDVQQHLFFSHVAHLVKQLEALDDFLDVGAEAIEVFLDVGQENLLVVGGGIKQFFQRPQIGRASCR